MRVLSLVLLTAFMALPLTAQQRGQMNEDPDDAVEGGGKLPAGWAARTDRNAPVDNVKFWEMGSGWHFTLGPAAVVYRESDKAMGNYHAMATFTQTKAPRHAEGYGLIVGGGDLQGSDQKYTYFLVRGDGKFLVKRRDGDSTSNINSGWTDHAAIKKADESGKATNALAVGVTGDRVSFTVNDKEVFTAEASALSTDGVVGFRVNHNLDVHVGGFAIHKM